MCTSELIGITGGIAFLTLFINGILGAPLIKKLELTRASDERKKIVKRYEAQIRRRLLEKAVRLLGEKRFVVVEFDFIQNKIPYLKDITGTELKFAVRQVKESTPIDRYKEPNLSIFDKHIDEKELNDVKRIAEKKLIDTFRGAVRRVAMKNTIETSVVEKKVTRQETVELRLVFIELVKHVYMDSIAKGEIDTRRGMFLNCMG